jgi:hypothetical protein
MNIPGIAILYLLEPGRCHLLFAYFPAFLSLPLFQAEIRMDKKKPSFL